MAALKASEYKMAMESHAAYALAECPTDTEMRCRLFVAFLANTVDLSDQKLAAKLRQVCYDVPPAERVQP
jgi:hypothetical protein